MEFSKRNANVVICAFVCVFSLYCHQNDHSKSSVPSVAPKTILTFLGAPGAGKGTLAKRVVEELHFKSLSTGDLCREEIASGSEKGKLIAQYSMQTGLVPDEMIAQMVEVWLRKYAGNEPIILDGYPRTQKQAAIFAELLKNKFSDYVFGVVFLEASDEEEIAQRIANRMVCQKCKAVHSRTCLRNPDILVCECCGSALCRRADDEPEVVRVRLKGFVHHNNEIISYYHKIGIHVELVNVTHRTSAEIFEDFKKILAVYAA